MFDKAGRIASRKRVLEYRHFRHETCRPFRFHLPAIPGITGTIVPLVCPDASIFLQNDGL